MVEFTARKSVWKVINFWSIISCIFIFPIFILIYRILAVKKETITFYDDKVVVKKGLLSTSEKSFAFAGVFSINIKQSLTGKIFDYASLTVDFVGSNDIDTRYVKEPKKLVAYLETRIVKRNQVQTFMH